MTTLKQKAVKYLVAVVIKTFYKFEKFEACVGFFFFKFLIGYNGLGVYEVWEIENQQFN